MTRRQFWMAWGSGCVAAAAVVVVGMGVGVPMLIGFYAMPWWMSGAAVLVAGVMSWRLARKARERTTEATWMSVCEVCDGENDAEPAAVREQESAGDPGCVCVDVCEVGQEDEDE